MNKKILLISFIFFISTSQLFAGFSVMGSLTKTETAYPGEKYQVALHVKHYGTQIEKLRIYLRDYLFDYSGKTYYPVPGTSPRSNASWIELQKEEISLNNDNEDRTILLTIKVPNDSSLTGTYWSTLMIEGINTEHQKTKGKVVINTSIRYAVKLITNMTSQGEKLLKFHSLQVVEQPNQNRYIQLILSNDGDYLLSPALSVQFFNQSSGQLSKKEILKPKDLFPGTSRIYQLPIDNVVSKGEKYTAIIIADGKEDNLFGIQYEFEL